MFFHVFSCSCFCLIRPKALFGQNGPADVFFGGLILCHLKKKIILYPLQKQTSVRVEFHNFIAQSLSWQQFCFQLSGSSP